MNERTAGPPLFALILAGGSGTRLWPLSRTLLPKQLLVIEGGQSLLLNTALRVAELVEPARILVVAGEEHVFEVRSQLKAHLPETAANTLAEPLGRNTLPAILLGLDRVVAVEPRAVVAVFPADHHIADRPRWRAAMDRAVSLAAEGWFVTLGVPPRHPETGYGYIRRGAPLGGDAFAVTAFTEKPDPPEAARFVASGDYFWNSGMFVFRADVFLEALATHVPELFTWWRGRDGRPLTAGYAGLPDLSVDCGLVEKLDHVAMVEARFDWDDLGSWEAVYRLGAKDPSGCVIRGEVIAQDCAGSLFYSQDGTLAATGVKDMLVVQTRDATLVCPLDETQRVREVVGTLKARGSRLVEAHLTVRRPWGSYTVLEEGSGYKIKRIEVAPGGTLSLQMHHHRSEHWVVVSGTAKILVGEAERLLTENQSVDIPKTTRHRLANPGKVAVEIIEIQTGPYLEEDDIVRYDDVYGRRAGAGLETR